MTFEKYKNEQIAKNYGSTLARRKALCSFDMKYIQKNCQDASRILDLGCGTGRRIVVLGKRHRVTGIDISPHMIGLAQKAIKKRRIKADLIVGDICSMNKLVKGKFDAVIMMYHTFGSIVPKSKRASLLKKIYSSLKDDGILIMHVHNRHHIKNLYFLYDTFKQSLFRSDVEFGDKQIKSGALQGVKIHFFSQPEIVNLLKNTGFKVIDFLKLAYPEEDRVIKGPKAALHTGGFIVKARKCTKK